MRRNKRGSVVRAVLLGCYGASVICVVLCLILGRWRAAVVAHLVMWILSVCVATKFLEEVIP